MIVLRDSTESLWATLNGANAHDFHVSYELEVPGGGPVTSKATSGQLTAAAAAAVLAAPATGAARIKTIFVRNTTANATTIVFGTKISSTTRAISPAISLASGCSLFYSEATGWKVYDSDGTVTA